MDQFITDSLEDKAKRIVDDIIPEEVHFENIEIISNSTFESIVQNNTYTVMVFFQPGDPSCLQFSARFDSLYDELHSSEDFSDVEFAFGALNC